MRWPPGRPAAAPANTYLSRLSSPRVSPLDPLSLSARRVRAVSVRRWASLPDIVRLDQLSAAVSAAAGAPPSYALVRGLAEQALRGGDQWRWDVSADWQMVRKGAGASNHLP